MNCSICVNLNKPECFRCHSAKNGYKCGKNHPMQWKANWFPHQDEQPCQELSLPEIQDLSTRHRVSVLTWSHFSQDIQGDAELQEWLTGTWIVCPSPWLSQLTCNTLQMCFLIWTLWLPNCETPRKYSADPKQPVGSPGIWWSTCSKAQAFPFCGKF